MYNPSHHAIVFMEVLSMNDALKTQLKILKLSDIKPNFSELARFYNLDGLLCSGIGICVG